MSGFKIQERTIGAGHRCFVIAEVAQAHDGSLGAAHAYIDAVANAGADCVKFQTHIASEESTLSEPWRTRFSRQDETRFDYWKRMEFTDEQWHGLAQHAVEKGLVFLSSPFSMRAFKTLESIGVPAWKVASGEITNRPMLEAMASTGKPVLLSTGLTTWSEMDELVPFVRNAGAPVAVFQTTTAYPCPPDEIGLGVLREIRRRYECPVGLSDHSGRVYAGLAAAALGADLLEVHVTLSRESFGPDTSSSVTTKELATIAEGVSFIDQALRNQPQKDVLSASQRELRGVFGKSVVTRGRINAGTRLNPEHLTLKKPGDGLPPDALPKLIGRTVRIDLPPDHQISDHDLD